MLFHYRPPRFAPMGLRVALPWGAPATWATQYPAKPNGRRRAGAVYVVCLHPQKYTQLHNTQFPAPFSPRTTPLNTQAVGYAAAYQQDQVLWLKKLHALPEIQGQGIGKKLVHALVEAFPDSQEIRLLVNRDNLPAQQFYIRQHFVQKNEVSVQMGDFKFVDLVFSKSLQRKE